MSPDVCVTAILEVKPEKKERLMEIMAECMTYIKEHQPYCLEFRVLEEPNAENPRLVLQERYESQEALEKHWSDPEYAKTMTMMQEEDLLAQAPNIIQGKLVEGFWSR